MRYFLGIDVGGSKTHALIADESGCAAGFGTAGTGNYQGVGYGGFRNSLHQSTRQALAAAGIQMADIAGAGFGIGGYDWPSQLPKHRSVIDSLGLDCRMEIVNDAVIGLVAGTSEGWGIAIVGGTGCNCRGRDRQGREGRVTGEGGRFGEWGGGIELVGKALQAVSHAWSRRGPQTELSNTFMQLTEAASLDDLIEGIDLGRYEPNASWAQEVFRVAYAGDPVAKQVIAWAGREEGELACAVIRQLDLQEEAFEVVQIGGLFDGGPLYTDVVHQTILDLAPKARFVRLSVPPVVGSVLLGAHAAGLPTARIREPLIRTTEELLRAEKTD
ncbi:MAG TPA: BadF/BadG/BcrA/BcrD ATPase family protein [Anaerolineales bacterium]|nr:BadF/BadG/BcrA/BcrD ATPase family protein [Anaerolineales bacterium]